MKLRTVTSKSYQLSRWMKRMQMDGSTLNKRGAKRSQFHQVRSQECLNQTQRITSRPHWSLKLGRSTRTKSNSNSKSLKTDRNLNFLTILLSRRPGNMAAQARDKRSPPARHLSWRTWSGEEATKTLTWTVLRHQTVVCCSHTKSVGLNYTDMGTIETI